MTLKRCWNFIGLMSIFVGMYSLSFVDTIANPCGGPGALLNLIDRPTVGDSACVVPFKSAILELGYQYQKLSHPAASYQQNLPEAEFRVGLPANNEFVILLPNYLHQSVRPHSGVGATTLGIKHELSYTQHWVAAVEGLFTLPTGSAAFGGSGLGAAVNGIFSYNFNPQFNLTVMVGGTTATEPSRNGGQRFNSFNPDVVFTYSVNPKLEFYAEIYGQSKTGPREGSGFNSDGGLIYLVLPMLAIDMEVDQRISGKLGGFNHYVGTGVSLQF